LGFLFSPGFILETSL